MTISRAKELLRLATRVRMIVISPQLVYPVPVIGRKGKRIWGWGLYEPLWGELSEPEVGERRSLLKGPGDAEWAARFKAIFQPRQGGGSSTVTYDPEASVNTMLDVINENKR